jgi:hypothetical protein
MPPDDLRGLLENHPNETLEDEEEIMKIESALKQWERQYQEGYPWKKSSNSLRLIAARLMWAEITGPAQNLPYYQDAETPDGVKDIIDDLTTRDDNFNIPREDIPRQGERPEKDIDTGVGDFSAPHDPIFTDVKPRGDGEDPDGMQVDFPPTGGDTDCFI